MDSRVLLLHAINSALLQQGGMQMADEPKAPVPMSSEPVRMLHLPYESARRLAMLPRINYYNESTVAAFAGTIAALPSATNAVLHSVKRNAKFSRRFKF